MKPNPVTGLLVTVLALAAPHAAGQALKLDYSTYVYGSIPTNIAVDDVGDVYLTSFVGTVAGLSGSGAFVAKLKPAGAGQDDLVWMTFLQPAISKVRFHALALDSAKRVYVLQRDGGSDTMSVLRFDSAGILECSTVLGKGRSGAITVHQIGTERFVYVTGTTSDPLFRSLGGFGGGSDAFVVKFKQNEGPPSLTFVSGTFLGGSGDDAGSDIAVDGMGNVHVTGNTNSPNFPTPGAFQAVLGGGFDAFVTKLNPSLGIEYSTFLGGAEIDNGRELAVDGAGQIYLTGVTKSPGFPATAGSFDTTFNLKNKDVFVAKLNPNVSGAASLVAATYLGGSGIDKFSVMALDGSGVLVAAQTQSSDFPTTAGALDSQFDGGSDTFLAKLSLDLTSLLYSTYFGGSKGEGSPGLAVGTAGSIYLSGVTDSSDFPTTSGAYQTARLSKGQSDGFMSKLSFAPLTAGITVSPTAGLVTTEGGGTDTFTVVLNTQPTDDVTIGISSSNTAEGAVSTPSLTFTTANWSTPQTVTVTGVDDALLDGNVGYLLVTAAALSADLNYGGLNPDDVSATNLDDDGPAGVTVTGITPSSMTAGTPTNVTITGTGFVTGASVTFENGQGRAPTASNIVVANSTTITATVSASTKGPSGQIVWDVRVTNQNASTGALPDGFTVNK